MIFSPIIHFAQRNRIGHLLSLLLISATSSLSLADSFSTPVNPQNNGMRVTESILQANGLTIIQANSCVPREGYCSDEGDPVCCPGLTCVHQIPKSKIVDVPMKGMT
jgi:hypothetical protein